MPAKVRDSASACRGSAPSPPAPPGAGSLHPSQHVRCWRRPERAGLTYARGGCPTPDAPRFGSRGGIVSRVMVQCDGDSVGRAALVADSPAAELAARAAARPPGSASLRDCSVQSARRSSAEGQAWTDGCSRAADVGLAARSRLPLRRGRALRAGELLLCAGLAFGGTGKLPAVRRRAEERGLANQSASSPRITCLYVISPLYE